ncbi:MAG TPA: cupin domain-containing protein [Thermoanaerobaculia bacterium]|nr:cupin domain-containing protein [Thermoanaerobaculia bacterium]HQR66602.1 cupin domain-containing protein [Thermoanaerobaculia bacterium]
MHPRAAELISNLKLEPHPEGGFFSQAFRSKRTVVPADGRPGRPALTVIWFLLAEGSVSRWHRLLSDEAWHHGEGAPVELFTAPAGGGRVDRRLLGPLSEGAEPFAVVPALSWQAARPTGAYCLVNCSVGPGFEYDDFTLLSKLSPAERPSFDPPSLLAELL